MAGSSRSLRRRTEKRRQNQVNLVSARSSSASELTKLSRLNSAGSYSDIRKKRATNRKIATVIIIVAASLLLAVAVVAGYLFYLDGLLSKNPDGSDAGFDGELYDDVFVEHEAGEPFWMLLLGTDDMSQNDGTARTDTIILARVDEASKTAALVSIPRDLWVNLGEHGYEKINSAYLYGELDQAGGGRPATIEAVTELTGVEVSYVAQVDFNGVRELTDGLGGVEVDVPVYVPATPDAGNIEIQAGLQTLSGEQALVFCRSREFEGRDDFQRQANQRVFLQAVAAQVLSASPGEIKTTVENLAKMTTTNMDILKLIGIAQGMRGMKENAIHTYTVPCSTYTAPNGQDALLAKEDELRALIDAIDAGNYPPPQEGGEYYQSGESPESYKAVGSEGSSNVSASDVVSSSITVDVRNGGGVDGAASSISDKLVIAGYKKGEVGNTDAFVYGDTLIIYKGADNRAAANLVRSTLGYGTVTDGAQTLYEYTGDVLVVIGSDYDG